MKQQINPTVFVVIIALAVVILGGAAYWIWMAPTTHAAPVAAVQPHPGGARESVAAMRAERMQHMAGGNGGQASAPQNTSQ